MSAYWDEYTDDLDPMQDPEDRLYNDEIDPIEAGFMQGYSAA